MNFTEKELMLTKINIHFFAIIKILLDMIESGFKGQTELSNNLEIWIKREIGVISRPKLEL